jgi:hypothetical protein
MACLIKPFVTTDWWLRVLSLLEKAVREVPCYEMRFDKSGEIVLEIEKLLQRTVLGCEWQDD